MKIRKEDRDKGK